MLGHRGQHLALVARGDLVELTGRVARLLEIYDGEHDLDTRGEQPRTVQGVGSLAGGSGGRARRPAGPARAPRRRAPLAGGGAGTAPAAAPIRTGSPPGMPPRLPRAHP